MASSSGITFYVRSKPFFLDLSFEPGTKENLQMYRVSPC